MSGSAGTLAVRLGVEVELLAPRGASRGDLATAIAAAAGGGVRRTFHRDSEPSAVPGMGTFRHLTPGFDVLSAAGDRMCSVVDDVTLVDGLDAHAPPLPGWHRLLTDDPRLLSLLAEACDPTAPLDRVLDPVAELFGTRVEAGRSPGDRIRKVADREGATVALAAPVTGERHRPAEIVTPVLERCHEAALEALLGPARELGCEVPREAAVHLHLDAAGFRTPGALANLVCLAARWRAPLWRLLGTNANCRRLAPPPQALVDRVPAVRDAPSWEAAVAAIADVPLSKYSDINLTALVGRPSRQDTVEVRVLPGMLSAAAVVADARLVVGLLESCRRLPELPVPTGHVDTDARALHSLAEDGCLRPPGDG
ncbi:MAG: amidoligase family protein [Kineosporiaceae bacterium]